VSKGNICNLINNSVETFDENQIVNSPIGLELLKAAKEEKKPKVKSTNKNLVSNKSAIISEEYDMRLKDLKKAEIEKDLCWFDYESFNSLNSNFREFFVQALNPTFWNGLFFRYSHLTTVENEIWSKLGYEFSVFELREYNGNYKLVILGNYGTSNYDFAGIQSLRNSQNNFNEKWIRAIGNTPQGVMIKNNPNRKETVNATK
jgi:hypothetical protein